MLVWDNTICFARTSLAVSTFVISNYDTRTGHVSMRSLTGKVQISIGKGLKS